MSLTPPSLSRWFRAFALRTSHSKSESTSCKSLKTTEASSVGLLGWGLTNGLLFGRVRFQDFDKNVFERRLAKLKLEEQSFVAERDQS